MPRALRALLAGVAITALLATPGVARARDSGGHEPSADPPLPPRGAVEGDALVDSHSRRSWNEGRPRAFAATTFDLGWVYVRPRITLGWGKPFNTFIGIDMNPVVSGNGLGAYGGLRLALPRFDIRAGSRYVFAFNREYLPIQEKYDRLDLSSTVGEPARIVTHEVEAEFSIPAGPGDFIGLGSLAYVRNIPDNRYVFEETLRVIVAPPIVWRGRGGYVVRFGSFSQHSIGVVADVLDVPKRDDSLTVRAGVVVRVVLSRHVEVRGSFVPTLISPDKLGVVGGDFTELGFRYRWATN